MASDQHVTFERVEYRLIVYLATIFNNVMDNLKIGDIDRDEAHLFTRYDGVYVVSPMIRDERRIKEHNIIAKFLNVPKVRITNAVERKREVFESPFYDVRSLARILYDEIIKEEEDGK